MLRCRQRILGSRQDNSSYLVGGLTTRLLQAREEAWRDPVTSPGFCPNGMNRLSMGTQGTRERLAGTNRRFHFGTEEILQLCAAATLAILGAVVIFVVKGAVGSLLSMDLESAVIVTAAANSLAIAAGAVIVALPVSLVSALYITELAPSKPARAIWVTVRLMSQVPSVVIGLIGLVWLTSREPSSAISPVMAAAAAPLLLALIIYPRFTSLLVEHLRQIPASLRASSYALGASRWQTIAYTVYPAARSGIAAAGFFGMGRAMGDTAVVLVLWQAFSGGNLIQEQSQRLFTLPTAIAVTAERGWHHSEVFVMALLIMIFSLVFSSLGRRFTQRHWRGKE